MISESIHLERLFGRPNPAQRPEPLPLFSVAERIALWDHQFGSLATDREWLEALDAGLIEPGYDG